MRSVSDIGRRVCALCRIDSRVSGGGWSGSREADWFGLIVRWIHFLAGITWIGLLYFFNLINAGFLKSLDGPTKNIVIPKLMPAALNWFRHGATVTVLAGIVLYGYLYSKGGTGAIALGIGGLLGIIMMEMSTELSGRIKRRSLRR